jgi:SAM-dependent methyltransferase
VDVAANGGGLDVRESVSLLWMSMNWTGAEAYEQLMGRWSRKLSPELIDFAGVEAGDRVLDVGCGTGSLCRALLECRPGVEVTGVDPARSYIEAARQQISSEKATFEEAGAQSLPFDNGYFDKSLALLVINFVPDAGRVALEMLRVTRPGGVVSAAVWDYGEGMQMFRALWDAAVGLDPSAESKDDRNMPYCRPGELCDLWSDSGFEHVREVALTIEMPFRTFDDYWGPFLSGAGPTASYLNGLSKDLQLRLRDQLVQELGRGRMDRPFTMPARAWAVRGEVPIA